MRFFLIIILLTGWLACKEKDKNTQAIMFTPRNEQLRKKMKKMGCECLYEKVKNRFFYNKNTGLYFGGTGYHKKDKSCYDRLSLEDVRQLYGPPHIETEEYLYYYCNVRYCGQHFDGLKLEKNETGNIIGLKSDVVEDIFPNDKTKQFEVRCRTVDYLDEEKMRINQDFFEYFDDAFVDEHFEVADYIRVMPKFQYPGFTERCTETIRYRQYNFIYNKKRKHYLSNYTYNSGAFPLIGYGEMEHLNCQVALNKPEIFIAAFGQPTYISENRDTIAYVASNNISKGRVPAHSYVWDAKYKAYIKKTLKNLSPSILPKVRDKCVKRP